MNQFHRHGFSLIELVVATLCLAITVVIVFSIFNLSNKNSASTAAYGDLKKELNGIAINITKMGYSAGNSDTDPANPACSSAATNVITCQTPNTPGVSEMRFIFQSNVLTQETRVGAGAWTVRARHPFVTKFVVCSDTRFQTNSCDIPSPTFNTFVRANLPTKRYFRFQIAVGAEKGKVTYTGRTDRESSLQTTGAFYLRNPGSIRNVSFIGGRKQ